MELETLRNSIRNIPDFPKKDIQFKDITTALKHPEIFSYIVEQIVNHHKNKGITKVVAIEARGFIAGGAIANQLKAGFVPIRKPRKLPAEKYSKTYELEYGNDTIEIHKDALTENDVVLLHDDLLATGGTAKAAIELLGNFNIKNICLSYLIELDSLKGRDKLSPYEIHSLIHF